jgi:hypothetical protein
MGLSKSRITAMKKRGMPVESVEAAQAWRIEHQSVARRKRETRGPAVDTLSSMPGAGAGHRFESHAAGDGRGGFDVARTRREVAEANLAEMREAELRSELIRVAVVESVWAQALASMREHLLQVRARLAPLLAAETDQFAIDQMLDLEHNQALQHMAGVSLSKATE